LARHSSEGGGEVERRHTGWRGDGALRLGVSEELRVGRREHWRERGGEALAVRAEDVDLARAHARSWLAELVLVGERGVDLRLAGEQRGGVRLVGGAQRGVGGERLAPRDATNSSRSSSRRPRS
jgi:hypothetical protein